VEKVIGFPRISWFISDSNSPCSPRDYPVCPTKEKYLAAIESLKAQAAKGGKFPFGIMSDGFEPLKGRRGEFQSNALCILKEFTGREVVYSFARPT
jgi:hypothetical protein